MIDVNSNNVTRNVDNNIIQVTNQDGNVVNITQQVTNTVDVVAIGPQGPVGPKGEKGDPGDLSNYTDVSLTGSFSSSGSALLIGPKGSTLETTTYPIGYYADSANPITGSGISVNSSILPSNHYNTINLGGIDIINYSGSFILNDVNEFIVNTGNTNPDVAGEGTLFKHNTIKFSVYINDVEKLKVDSSGISGNFIGNLTGNATTANIAAQASTVQFFPSKENNEYRFPLLDVTSTSPSFIYTGIESSSFTYNPSSNRLTISGSLITTGSIKVTGGVTGSLYGTASWATDAISASYALNSTDASQAISASYASISSQATSASYALTASHALNAQDPFPYTGSAIISGGLTITGSLSTTGDVSLLNLPAEAKDHVVLYDTADGKLYITASSAFGGGSTGSGEFTPAGPDKAIQFNDAGIISGSGNLTFNKSSNILNLTGSLVVSVNTQIGNGNWIRLTQGSYIPSTGIDYNPKLETRDDKTLDIYTSLNLFNNKLIFDNDSSNTYIVADTLKPENLEVHAEGNILLAPDNKLIVSSSTLEGITLHAPLTASIISASSITGSLYGTASYAISTSYAPKAEVASAALSITKANLPEDVLSPILFQFRTSSTPSNIPSTGEFIEISSTFDLLKFSTQSYNNINLIPSLWSEFFYKDIGSLLTLRETGSGNFKTYRIDSFEIDPYNPATSSVAYETILQYVVSSGSLNSGDIVEFIWNKDTTLGSLTTGSLVNNPALIQFNPVEIYFSDNPNIIAPNATPTSNNLNTIDYVNPFYVAAGINYTQSLTLNKVTVNEGFYGNLVGSSSYAFTSSQATSASYSLNSNQATSASYSLSSSQAASASYSLSSNQAVSASYSLSSSQATSASYSLTSSQAASASYALTASHALNVQDPFPYTGSAIISGGLTTFGPLNQSGSDTIILKGLINQTNPQSHVVTFDNDTGQLYITASSAFGGGGSSGGAGGVNYSIQYNDAGALGGRDNFTFDGNSTVNLTGSLIVSGGSITGGLIGTSSWANNTINASYALNSTTSSYALTSSYLDTDLLNIDAITVGDLTISNDINFSGIDNLTIGGVLEVEGYITGSVLGNLTGTASYASQALSSSYALTSNQAVSASYSLSSSQATTASYALTSNQATSASYSLTSSQATSASYSLSSSQAISASYSLSSSQATTASHALTSNQTVSASYSLSSSQATTASHALTSNQTVSASYSLTSSQATSASYATLALNVINGGGGSVGTLQQVTDQGASTTTSITASIISASQITSSDVYINNWGSVSASLATAATGVGTLQQVTNNGNSTNIPISASTFTATTTSGVGFYGRASQVLVFGSSTDVSTPFVFVNSNGDLKKQPSSSISLTYVSSNNLIDFSDANLSINGIPNVSASIALAAASGGGGGGGFPYEGIAEITGSFIVTSSTQYSTTILKTPTTISGSLTTTGSVILEGLKDQITPQSHVVTYNNTTGQLYITASNAFGGGAGSGTPSSPTHSIQFNDAGVFGGSERFTMVDNSTTVDVALTGSLKVTQNIDADEFNLTGTGIPTITSNTNLNLSASNAVVVKSPVLRLTPNTTGSILTPQPGDIIYDYEQDKFFGRTSTGWVAFN